MKQPQPAPLIITLKLDQASFAKLDLLRRTHFPPERNFIPAHITLFHALPGEQFESIVATLISICQQTEHFPIIVSQPRSLGRGVAITIESPALLRIRGQLADAWQGWLTPQDQQRYKPHLTIQNKVSSTAAQELLATLSASWQPLSAMSEGLSLWRYLGGPWGPAGEFEFAPPALNTH